MEFRKPGIGIKAETTGVAGVGVSVRDPKAVLKTRAVQTLREDSGA